MTYNGKDFDVEAEMSFDPLTGKVRVVFQSLDPGSELPPDVLTGMLPPEDGTGRGKGYVAFRVRPKAALPSGTELRNVALIKFDVNDVIATNQIDPQNPAAGTSAAREALNTIDAGLPTSTVDALPAITNTTDFVVNWSGSDDPNGSGIGFFDIFVSIDAGPSTLWLPKTPLTSATYSGMFGHSYAFYSVATDNVGHQEPTPVTAQATTTLQQFSSVDVSLTSDHPAGSVYGQDVFFTAIVSAVPPAGTPTGTVQFQVDGNDLGTPLALVGGTASVDTSLLSAGNHAVTVIYVSDSGLFEDGVGGPLSQLVDPASLVITGDDQTKVYGAALLGLTASYSGFVNGDTTADLTASPVLSTTATAASHVLVSGYPITASGAAGDNYAITYVSGTLTVTPAALTITADYMSKVYGAALPTLTASYSGFVNGDADTSLTALPILSTTATTASHVADSPFSIVASGASSADYAISFINGVLTITPAPLTITADDKTKVYGDPLPALTASYAGFVNGDDQSTLTMLPTLATTATAAGHVMGSPYPITASGAVGDDYAISYVSGLLDVTAVSLTIAADNKSKVYGAALPMLTASFGGFVNGDTASSLTTQPTLSTSATAASHVAGSPYPIAVSGAVGNSDYLISYASGELDVTPAPLMIAADDKSKVYGCQFPR